MRVSRQSGTNRAKHRPGTVTRQVTLPSGNSNRMYGNDVGIDADRCRADRPPARRRSVPMIHGLSVARRSRTIVALAFPLLLCAGAARAQTARLSGVVTDSAGGYPVRS